ncbi:MAG: hypothetical protein A2798_03935 [Candidatus Levybacteria bacterium RIFCSPHIGHO2_01_FULL_37_17]|nr:MAG: hypothetical protein A2798_03935 [Candidatus Levybacteria bacterium RIFCSPHIGHO2_01_FULL_37_17]OGH36618.1 MAG: hypothetical protein A2959_03990 [Candidatus Levybacteria bacterium RIFCSPLOWO2_01_FULL_38_23]
MTATGHAVIGTVIAAKIGNPSVAIPIAIASHFAADLLPHWDTGYHRRHESKTRFFLNTAFDVLLSFVLSYFIIKFLFVQTSINYAFLMVFMAQLPDWLTAPYVFFDIKYPPFTWIYMLQKKFDRKKDLPWGFMNQVAILAAIVILAKIL